MLNPVGAFHWCSARPKLQPRVLSLVLVVVWFNRSRSEASPSVVHQDKYLPGNVIRQLHLSDWLLCLSACESATECISYNFDPRLGICDINDAGLNTADSKRKCQEDSNLVFSKGVIFHQIRGKKISQQYCFIEGYIRVNINSGYINEEPAHKVTKSKVIFGNRFLTRQLRMPFEERQGLYFQ